MSPRSAEQFNEIREESKQKIIDAALTLFAKKGYENASISMIAKEAGVSKGLMYNYFDSKEDLLQGVITNAMKRTGHIFVRFMELNDPREKMKVMIDGVFKFLREHKGYYRLITALALQEDAVGFIKEIAVKKVKEMTPIMLPVFEALGFENAYQEALIFGTLHDGLAVRYLSTNDEKFMDEMYEYLINRYTK